MTLIASDELGSVDTLCYKEVQNVHEEKVNFPDNICVCMFIKQYYRTMSYLMIIRNTIKLSSYRVFCDEAAIFK